MKFDSQSQKDLLLQLVLNTPVSLPVGKLTETAHEMQNLVEAMRKAEIEDSADDVP